MLQTEEDENDQNRECERGTHPSLPEVRHPYLQKEGHNRKQGEKDRMEQMEGRPMGWKIQVNIVWKRPRAGETAGLGTR